MSADTDLDLVFRNTAGKKVTLNIEEPKTGVTKAEIDAAMQVVVENNIFNTTHFKMACKFFVIYFCGSVNFGVKIFNS